MASNEKSLKVLEHRMSKVISALSNNDENWRPRIEAMTSLIELVNKGNSTINNFDKVFATYLANIAEPLVIQLGDLRSEITSIASQTVSFLAETFGVHFARTAAKMISGLLELSGATNNLIRSHVHEAVISILKHTHNKSVLKHILDTLKSSSKSKLIVEACSEYLVILLEIWPMNKYKSLLDDLDDVLINGLKARAPHTREISAKCVALVLHQFIDRREYIYSILDIRARKLVERMLDNLDPEEEDADYNDIRKGLQNSEPAKDSLHIDTRQSISSHSSRPSSVNRRNTISRSRSSVASPTSRKSIASPSVNRPSSTRKHNNSRHSIATTSRSLSTPRNSSTRSSSTPRHSSTPRNNSISPSHTYPKHSKISSASKTRRNTTMPSSLTTPHRIRHRSQEDGNERPVSTSAVPNRRNTRRALSEDHYNLRSNSSRSSTRNNNSSKAQISNNHKIIENLTNDEKQALTLLYNEHQNYLAKSAVNLKDLHSQLTTGRLKSPLDTYLSMTIHHIDEQLQLAQQLKNKFIKFKKIRSSNSDEFLAEMDNFS